MNIHKLICALGLLLSLTLNYTSAISQEGTAGVKITDIVTGEGQEAVVHSQVLVHYTGWLMDGTKFDSSLDRGEPFPFSLGTGQVIPGWDKGVDGMRVGGKRELIISPEMAYGDRGAGSKIPGGSTLKFEVELLAVELPLYKQIGLGDVVPLVARGAKVIDIRSLDEAKKTGVIESARVITAFDENFKFQQSFVKAFQAYVAADDVVVLVGLTNRSVISLAHIISSQGGYKNINALSDGMQAWVAAEMITVSPFE